MTELGPFHLDASSLAGGANKVFISDDTYYIYIYTVSTWFRKKDDDLFQSWCRFPTHADMAPRAVFGYRSQNCMPTHTLGTYYERVSQHPIP